MFPMDIKHPKRANLGLRGPGPFSDEDCWIETPLGLLGPGPSITENCRIETRTSVILCTEELSLLHDFERWKGLKKWHQTWGKYQSWLTYGQIITRIIKISVPFDLIVTSQMSLFMCSHHNCLVIVRLSAIDCDVISRT